MDYIYEDMVILCLTLSNIFYNGRVKYATHFNGWSIYHPFIIDCIL